MKWYGVHTALVTPFAGDGVELERFERLCDRQVRAGVQGLVPCGTTGETPTLSDEEWADVVEAAVRVSGGRVPVTAGCGTNDTAASVRRIERAAAMGADAALVVLPYYNKPPPAGLRAHVRACAAPGLPLVLYHVPGRTGQRVPPALLAELCNVEGVAAVKEATGDLAYANDLLRATARPVLSGDDFTFFPLLTLGGAGVISVLSNVAPTATVALYAAAAAGNLPAARELHFRLLPVVDWLFHTTSPMPCKALMAAGGLCDAACRLPLVALDAPVPTDLLELLEP